MVNYIVLAIPAFFLLIGIELWVSWRKNKSYYRFNDAVTNISCGIGSQLSGVFLKTITFAGYLFIYEHQRLFDIPNAWWVWIVLFIGIDFFYYWFHRYAHQISFLWGSHIVHHQSEEYNLSVALRQAWLQGAFSWIFYLPLAFIGFEPVLFLAINSFQTLYQFWIHTKAIGKLPKAFEFIFNTPSHHRVHHGVNPKYIDRNHGGTLIIFDRMFGTFQAEEEEVVYGITTQTGSWNPLWVNFQYWIDLFAKVSHVKSWKDRWLMLAKEPGWQPQELGGPLTAKEVTPETFHKYDTEVTSGMKFYILFQFVVTLIGATGFLMVVEDMDWYLRTGLASLVILSIVNLGAILEKKKWVYYLEYMRILTISLTFVLSFYGSDNFFWMAAIFAVFYLAVSLFWYSRQSSVLTQSVPGTIQSA